MGNAGGENRFVQELSKKLNCPIIGGCAGLKALTGEITPIKSLGLYLFGEVCMAKDQAVFGNLMLSKLRLRKVK